MLKNIGKKRPKVARVPRSLENGELKRRPKDGRLDESMYLQPQEIEAFFAVITSKRDRALFRLVYHRGLRAHEPGLLDLSDFRDRDGVLYVKRGKGSISREHSLTDNELKALRSYIRDERGKDPGPLFPSRQGRKGISRFRLDDLMKDYCSAAGIRREKAHMHALKHSCGTHLADRGASPAEIQDWLGHRESSSTDIYTHFSPTRRRASVDKHRDW
jgi:integrase/recombinase XerD